MKYLVPLAAMAAAAAYVQGGGQQTATFVLLAAVGLYLVGSLLLMRD